MTLDVDAREGTIFPLIRYWQRLEPRSRSNDFSKSIQAQIRDPLWMLSRQWQFGEFIGEDGGSPVKAKLKTTRTHLTRLKLGGEENDNVFSVWKKEDEKIDAPLESFVEQENFLQTDISSPIFNLKTRVQIGLQFQREIKTNSSDEAESRELINLFKEKTKYQLKPISPDKIIEVDDQTHEFAEILSEKTIDGKELIDIPGMREGNPQIPDDIVILEETKRQIVIKSLKGLGEWFSELYQIINETNEKAWQDERLEYEFSVSAPLDKNNQKQAVLVSSEYQGGNLDWHDFSFHHDDNSRLGSENPLFDGEGDKFSDEFLDEFIPSNLDFNGMPNHRWWEFEDSKTDFGKMVVNTTDLAKLLVMDFALVSGNDWFLNSLPMKVGELCQVTSLEVSDVFGDVLQVPPASNPNIWNMFGLSIEPKTSLSNSTTTHNKTIKPILFLPPTLAKTFVSTPLEEVKFVRDEMANMVWSIEHTISNGVGQPISGYEDFRDRTRREQENNPQEEPDTPEPPEEETVLESSINYHLSKTVPDNWIPWVPVHVGGSNREIQFGIAKMVRNAEDQDPVLVNPRTYVLNSMKDNERINEEAVTRAATSVKLEMQRARWTDGSTYLWLGRRVQPGGGPASSGLRFDFIDEK